jgi:RimJ/RimL family protein N-acetyltransferase
MPAVSRPVQPLLETQRLTLRAFTMADAPQVQRLAGDRDIASTTLVIPHPYEDGMAEAWIGTLEAKFAAGRSVILAITLRDCGELIGGTGLAIEPEHNRAELGYWIGKPFWNHGYATEAGKAMLHYAFATLQLNRVYAYHYCRNPASGRVLQKMGMTHEGRLRRHTLKWGVFEDDDFYGILRSEYAPE